MKNEKMETLHSPFSEKKHGMEFWCCNEHRDEAAKEREYWIKKKISKNDLSDFCLSYCPLNSHKVNCPNEPFKE